MYNRLRRWVHSEAMRRLFEATIADPAFWEVRRVLVDSTTDRAHRHAAEEKMLEAARAGLVCCGLTRKVVVMAAAEDTGLAVDVVAGSRHHAPLLNPMLDATATRVGAMDPVVGDKGFDGGSQQRAGRSGGRHR